MHANPFAPPTAPVRAPGVAVAPVTTDDVLDVPFDLTLRDVRWFLGRPRAKRPSRVAGVLAVLMTATYALALAGFALAQGQRLLAVAFASVLGIRPAYLLWLRRRVAPVLGPARVVLRTDGVGVTLRAGTAVWPWTQVEDATLEAEIVRVTVAGEARPLVLVPRRAFASPADAERFVAVALGRRDAARRA